MEEDSIEQPRDPNMDMRLPHDIEISKVSYGGSVLVDKINEPLDAIKKALEGHVTALNGNSSKATRISKP